MEYEIENPHACIFFVFHFEVSLEYFFPGGQIKVAQNEKQTKKNMANFVCILLLGYFISEEWNRIECYAMLLTLFCVKTYSWKGHFSMSIKSMAMT